jgi:hypothetical protein
MKYISVVAMTFILPPPLIQIVALYLDYIDQADRQLVKLCPYVERLWKLDTNGPRTLSVLCEGPWLFLDRCLPAECRPYLNQNSKSKQLTLNAKYKNGELHADALPSARYFDGTRLICSMWHKNGIPHRATGVAIIYHNWEGDVVHIFMRDGLIHRDGDDPAVCSSNSMNIYMQHGVLSRTNGPAFKWGSITISSH